MAKPMARHSPDTNWSCDNFLSKVPFDELGPVSVKSLHLAAVVAQLVRALDCGSKCRGFEPRRSPIFF